MAILDHGVKSERWFIYVLRDPRTNEIRYLGKTIHPQRRMREHMQSAQMPATRSSSWIKSLLTAGVRPVMDVIDAGRGTGHGAAERAWIAEHRRRGTRLTNLADGGWSGPCSKETDSHDTRLKMRLAKLGKKQSPEVIERRRQHLLGRKFSPEHRERIAASKRGKPRDDATRAKLCAAQTGRKQSPESIEKSASKRRGKNLSPEVCRRISDARKGYVPSVEHRRNIAEARKGTTIPTETREKIAASLRGRPRPDVAARMKDSIVSDETRAKISEANRGRQFSDDHMAKLRAGHLAYYARKKANQTNNGEPEEGSD